MRALAARLRAAAGALDARTDVVVDGTGRGVDLTGGEDVVDPMGNTVAVLGLAQLNSPPNTWMSAPPSRSAMNDFICQAHSSRRAVARPVETNLGLVAQSRSDGSSRSLR